MNQIETESNLVSQGVDQLISRLRQEGVEAGNAEAKRVIQKARSEARALLEKADRRAKYRIETAQRDADALFSGGQEALKTAMRDMVLSMKTALTEGFKSDLTRLIKRELQQPDILKSLVLEIAGKAKREAKIDEKTQMEMILPEQAVDLEELQSSPNIVKDSPLTELVFGLTQDMLKRGVTFQVSDDLTAGMQVKLKDRDVILDFSEQAVASMLLEHLQPRFRAILEGVVR